MSRVGLVVVVTSSRSLGCNSSLVACLLLWVQVKKFSASRGLEQCVPDEQSGSQIPKKKKKNRQPASRKSLAYLNLMLNRFCTDISCMNNGTDLRLMGALGWYVVMTSHTNDDVITYMLVLLRNR
jgi:hypothetical protein